MKTTKYTKHLIALNKFNAWEKVNPICISPTQGLTMAGELYDLLPTKSRQRRTDVEGIIQMRNALSRLKTTK